MLSSMFFAVVKIEHFERATRGTFWGWGVLVFWSLMCFLSGGAAHTVGPPFFLRSSGATSLQTTCILVRVPHSFPFSFLMELL